MTPVSKMCRNHRPRKADSGQIDRSGMSRFTSLGQRRSSMIKVKSWFNPPRLHQIKTLIFLPKIRVFLF